MNGRQLFQAHARCNRNPLAVLMSHDKRPMFHVESDPMPLAEAEALMAKWIAAVTSRDWRFSVEPAASNEPSRPA